MARTHLIVNADDFGENEAVNRAIIDAYRRGIVTSTSLMVTGDAVEDALEQARSHPGLRVGLHVVLMLGRPCLPPADIPALVTPAGTFPTDAMSAGLRWFLSLAAREQIRREVWAQVACFQRTGLPLDHLDAHLHFHIHPAVFDVLMEVMNEVGVRRLRLPVEPWRISLPLDARHLGRKVGYIIAFGLLARVYRRRLREGRVFCPQAVFGLLQTGDISETYLLRLIPRLPAGVVEFYAHPRYDTAAGLRELHALVSPRVRAAVERRDILLTTYDEASGG